MKKRAVVVGAGPSGLLTAYFLSNYGYQVEILEASHRAGGWVCSERIEETLFEWGPHSILADQRWLSLFRELGLEPQFKREQASARYIWRNGQKHALSFRFDQIITSKLLSPRAKLRLLRTLFYKHKLNDDCSLEAFCIELFGEEVTRYIIDPFFGGIFAGEIHRLSAKACLAKLWNQLQSDRYLWKLMMKNLRASPAKTVSFHGGMEVLTDQLLKKSQAKLHRNCPLIELKPGWTLLSTENKRLQADVVVMAIPAYELAHLIEPYVPSRDAQFLKSIPYQKMGVWNCLWQKPQAVRGGFGCLIPRHEGYALRGSLWPSEIFENRCKETELVSTQYFSGDEVPEDPWEHLPFVQQIIETQAQPMMSRYRILERAIPQFEVGHCEKVQALRASLPPGLALVGNYLDGVGMSGIMQSVESCLSLRSVKP